MNNLKKQEIENAKKKINKIMATDFSYDQMLENLSERYQIKEIITEEAYQSMDIESIYDTIIKTATMIDLKTGELMSPDIDLFYSTKEGRELFKFICEATLIDRALYFYAVNSHTNKKDNSHYAIYFRLRNIGNMGGTMDDIKRIVKDENETKLTDQEVVYILIKSNIILSSVVTHLMETGYRKQIGKFQGSILNIHLIERHIDRFVKVHGEEKIENALNELQDGDIRKYDKYVIGCSLLDETRVTQLDF